jgi:hypothetical protein
MRFGSDWVMNSKAIVARLEAEYPIPSLHLHSPILAEVVDLVSKIRTPLRPLYYRRIILLTPFQRSIGFAREKKS